MGLVHAPVVSMHPTSEQQGDNKKVTEDDYRIVDKAFIHITADEKKADVEFKYPFNELELEQGLFIPVPEGGTTDQLMSEMYKMVANYRKQFSDVERDENGDDVMVDQAINVKKRNEDGTVQLDGGVPRLGIKSGFVPKLIGPNFIIKAIVKDDEIADGDKAEHDGVLVVRMG